MELQVGILGAFQAKVTGSAIAGGLATIWRALKGASAGGLFAGATRSMSA